MNSLPRPQTAQLAIPEIVLTAFGIIALLLVNKAGIAGNLVFFATLAVMIAHSPEMAFRALTLCLVGLVSNQAIVLKTPVWTVARLLMPALCFARFFLDLMRLRQPLLRPHYIAALAVFIGVAAILSILTNYYVHIALLKLVNFAIGSLSLLMGIRVLSLRRTDLTPWFVAVALAIVMISFASIPLGIGYNFRGELAAARGLFNGAFYHSNTNGPMSAMLAVLMACVVVFGPYRNRWLCGAIGAGFVFFVLLTRSRTGLGSFIIGFLTLVVMAFMLQRRGLLRLRMRISRLALVGCLVLSGALAVGYEITSNNQLSQAAITFAQKGKQTEQLSVENVLSSRQGLINYMWSNFLESPWIGIGFEVSTLPYFQENATILNAPIEKGFLPVAVLEETGIIGTAFFVWFLATLALTLARNLNVPGIALLVTFLAVNCGEAMFFSLGGHGAFGWLLMVAGIMLGQQCVVRADSRVPRRDRAMPVPSLPQLRPTLTG